jgi:hypothetical protein
MTQHRPRTRGYDPTWRIFEGGTGFAPHPWSLSAGPGMVRLPAYAAAPPTAPNPPPEDMTAPLHPEMLDLAAAPFLPGRQPAGPLLPALDHRVMWDQHPAATPRLPRRPPRRRTRIPINRPRMAGAGLVALVVIVLAAFLPAIHASQRMGPPEIATPLIVPPATIAEAAISPEAEPAAVRVAFDPALPPPAAADLPARLDLALAALPAEPWADQPVAAHDHRGRPHHRLDAEREARHAGAARPHATPIRAADPQAAPAFSRELRFVIDLPSGIAPR